MSNENKGKFVNGMFNGKVLKGSGTGAKGEWKRFQLSISVEDGGERSFTCFGSITPKSQHQVSDLEEGKCYNFGYNEEERVHGPTNETYIAKNIFYISDPKEKIEKGGDVTDYSKPIVKEEKVANQPVDVPHKANLVYNPIPGAVVGMAINNARAILLNQQVPEITKELVLEQARKDYSINTWVSDELQKEARESNKKNEKVD